MNQSPININLDPGAPFSQEAEEAVIGSILIDPGAYIIVAAFLKSGDFFLLRHNIIWQAFERLNERGEPIDHITLAEELENHKQLEEIGGRAYLIQLANNMGTSMHAEVYGRLVERTSISRKLMTAGDDIKRLGVDEKITVHNKILEAENIIFRITEQSSDARKGVSFFDALMDYHDYIESLMQHRQSIGIPSGFRDVDALLGGFQKSDFVIVAGRPGSGKTSYLLSIAANVARMGGRVAIFSLEMSIQQLIMRFVAMETGINVQKLRLGKLTAQEAARFTEAIGRMGNWKLFLDDTPALNPADLRTRSRRWHHEYGLDMVIVDYLQLMNEPSIKNNRVQEVGYISRTTKGLAKELNLPIIAASQLSRAVEKRQDKRPILSDLRESGEQEQDTDVIQFLYRDEYYNENTEFPNQAEIITAKHRNGPTGTVSLYFEKSLTKFMDASVHRIDLSDLG